MKIDTESYCDESKIQKTIEICKTAFYEAEDLQTLSPMEFLYQQSLYVKKQWWIMQAGLLLVLCLVMQFSGSDYFIRRSMGVVATLFVILILPELWKNRSCNAMEVEGTCFYNIRHVYAARLSLFAGVDLLLLTAFFLGASFLARMTIWELLIQFVLPFNVSCCICFKSLYNSRNGSEVFSILLCSVWTGIWVLIVLSENIYNAISVPVWIMLLAMSFVVLGYSIFKGQRKMDRIWEVKPTWN